MTIFGKRDEEGGSGRTGSRKSKQNRLFWTAAAYSARLEPRIMPTLTVTTFQIPLVALVEPQGITTGPDGNLWFAENGAGEIGRMTPAGVVTNFALPQVPPPAGSPAGTASTTPHPTAITAGPDGALWFTGIPGEIGRITTAGVVTEFPLPTVPPPPGSTPGTASTLATATAIVAGPDGALWFTGIPGQIGRITTTGVVTEFAVPEIPAPAGSAAGTAATLATLTAITAGPDGALWFAGVPGEVGRITTAGVVSEFPVPAVPPPSGSPPGTAGTPATLEDITAGPDGALWFTGVPGEVGRISTKGVVTEYATPNFNPPGDGIVMITTGSDGNLWLTAGRGIGRMTPTGSFTSFSVPGTFSTIGGLAPGPGGNVWFTEQENAGGGQPAIGDITPAGVTTLHPIPQWTTLNPNLGIPANPQQITAGPDGALWFVDSFDGNPAIGRITTAGAIQQFPLPDPQIGETIGQIAAGPDDSVWFTEQNGLGESIGRITQTGAITEYPLPGGGNNNANGAYITAGPNGKLWFTESSDTFSAIGEISGKRATVVASFPSRGMYDSPSLGNIVTGPDGNLWFTAGGKGGDYIGKVTTRGKVTMYHVTRNKIYSGSYPPGPAVDVISGPGGTLWFEGTVHGTTGIARITTSGKLESVIPDLFIGSNMVLMADGRVWFNSGSGVATRSGILVTEDLPSSSPTPGGGSFLPISLVGETLARGPDGNLWSTAYDSSSIVRISGLQDAFAGGLDYRHRPRRTPDYSYDQWTNVSGTATPSFAGIATPGAEVTLWAQKQGNSQPISIGQAKASKTDGSWTLKSEVKLSDGNYAVTATETGNAGPPAVLYSLQPDSYGDLSNALVIATTGNAKGNASHRSQHIEKTALVSHANSNGTRTSHEHVEQPHG